MVVVARRIRVEDNGQRPQARLRAVVRATWPKVVVEDVPEERRPVVVEHPVDRHLVVVPPAGGERFELSARRLVMRQLRLAREFLRVLGRPVPAVDGAPNTGQGRVFRVRTGMEVPGVVDRPELVRWNELLEARERRDLFVVTLFGGRPTGGGVTAGEPVARWSPAVRPRHLDA